MYTQCWNYVVLPSPACLRKWPNWFNKLQDRKRHWSFVNSHPSSQWLSLSLQQLRTFVFLSFLFDIDIQVSSSCHFNCISHPPPLSCLYPPLLVMQMGKDGHESASSLQQQSRLGFSRLPESVFEVDVVRRVQEEKVAGGKVDHWQDRGNNWSIDVCRREGA